MARIAKQVQSGFMHGIKSLFAIQSVPRPLSLIVICSFFMAMPLMAGVLAGYPELGLTTCVGSLLGLYGASFTPGYRASALLKMLLPFAGAYILGLVTQQNLAASAFFLGLVAVIAIYLALYKRMRPPAGFFFIMVCCLSKTHPVALSDIPVIAGAFLAGSLMVTVAVYLHDLITVKDKPQIEAGPSQPFWQLAIAVKALVVGGTVGGSYYFASVGGIDNPYWVSITVAAILQGQRMTDFWQRSLHRATGTALGMLLATGIFAFSPSPLVLIILLFVLAFTIEMLIAKNYALACIFITPLTVILAHTASIESGADMLILARMIDVLIGAGFALVAGGVLKALPVENR
ncbi:FUSC family protein [Alteromonas sp. AMM-1]|uniref:FUSC family protein n=1 Tax=Alteromonas sp. AMM-1 TaxID=3394233 RepID=UPI0039A77227